jgi:hypothetical protein
MPLVYEFTCLYCGKSNTSFSPTKKYCKKSHRRMKKEREKANYEVIGVCQDCGAQFKTTIKNRGKRKYCDQCAHEIHSMERAEETKRKIGESNRGKKRSLETRVKMSVARGGDGTFKPPTYCDKWDEPFRERVRNFFNRTCTLCGKIEADNIREKTGKPMKMSVHHVNYKKEACCDENIPKLFVCLCHKCHMKTNSNRRYWKILFTAIIKTRFKNKCYLPKESS